MLETYPADLQEYVQQKIASGEFKSARDFAIHAARVYRDWDRRHQVLKQLVAEGIADLDAGNYIELKNDEELREFGEQIKREGRQRLGMDSSQFE